MELIDILLTQDFNRAHAEKICKDVSNDDFDTDSDPITAFIISKYQENDNAYDRASTEAMILDLSYAIDQLSKAKYILNISLKNLE